MVQLMVNGRKTPVARMFTKTGSKIAYSEEEAARLLGLEPHS